MSPNPLDWPPATFLIFYMLLLAATVGITLLHRRSLRGAEPVMPAGAADLNLLELAYLSRGPDHVADTALVGLMSAGAASFQPARPFRKAKIHIDAGAARLSALLEPFRRMVSGDTTRAAFRKAVFPRVEDVGQGLARRGLAPSPGDIGSHRRLLVMLLCVPLVLGTPRLVMGLSHGRPVGFLVVLMGLTVLIGFGLYRKAPWVTREGCDALRESRIRHARAARAPLGEELALAFALTGAAVLAGTHLAPYGAHITTSVDSGGGDFGGGGSGGGDSGGGCGGGGCSS